MVDSVLVKDIFCRFFWGATGRQASQWFTFHLLGDLFFSTKCRRTKTNKFNNKKQGETEEMKKLKKKPNKTNIVAQKTEEMPPSGHSATTPKEFFDG